MPDIPTRLETALADRYRLERELGQGGMATVYLAYDVRHDRKVALKVLRPELSAILGADRFLAEIKTTAHLQHPHILSLFDSGEADGLVFYVMPYIEGESLRDRLNREKQLPIDDAVRIASEVADALEYAHQKGIIHRDIKPENILLHGGHAQVADFGIALAVSRSNGGTRMTETGMSLGTPHYMSPEQAMGERELTARSDVYALGAMTYEMLVGEPPFTGPTAQAIIAKVMTGEPAPIIPQRKSVPPAVEAAVLTALAKLPADRFGSAAEFASALHGTGTAVTMARPVQVAAADRRLLHAVSALAVLATLAALFFAWRATQRPSAPVTRLTLDLPDLRVNHLGYYGIAFALAPDGSRLAYITEAGWGDRGGGVPGSPTRLMVRERGDLTPRFLEGTEGADGPFFSPDGRWIGYTAGDKLFKVAVGGGPPVQLADGVNGVLAGGAWLEDDRIAFTNQTFEILAVPAAGGPAKRLARAVQNTGLVFPTALPRRDAILITACGNNCAQMTLMSFNMKTQQLDTVLPNAAIGRYLPTGQLVAVRSDGSVVSGAFDLGRLKYTSAPTVLVNGIQLELGIIPELSLANDGTLIYLAANQAAGSATVAQVDRSGNARVLDQDWLTRFTSMALSPDGRQLAVSTAEGPSNVLWVKQLDRGPLTKLSFGGTINYRPAWSPDGRMLSFSSDIKGPYTYLYQMRADGSDKPERLLAYDTSQVDEATWSRDGRWLVYRNGVIAGVRDIYARRTSGDTARITIAAGAADEYSPALSPDGRWIAYVSVESGREEIYVRPFPETSRARWQVSTAGGAQPAWSHSGRELFYVDRFDSLVSVSVGGGADFQAGGHHALFSTHPFVLLPYHLAYAVTPDDRSFIMFKRSVLGGTEARRLTVVLNWFSEVAAKTGKAP
ncbi:MAG TPA: protein kinase [Gemmatimonadales bacterium]|nr:protein kinase [Gemmatimonadales bacterium]